ncbi:MAG: asparagine synthase (glutamine-hydrolyzing) [Gemmatimonadota bacterium]|nr:asparagine synthase (glutamine-hydrolyzing) [Gemmatimonadota bacterium]
MCGIYGMVALAGVPLQRASAADGMARALVHRGPDGQGRWVAPDALIGVTRLRVVDLDPRADQPFTDPTGTVVLACNGEIYNAAALRRRYADYPYRSSSDVEVILPLYLDRGATGLADLNGMFALAVFDQRVGQLVLARDRAGEKPLFTTRVGGEWWFASEIGALLSSAAVSRTLDRAAMHAVLRHGYASEPHTPFTTIKKVPAGTIVTIADRGVSHWRYWDPDSDRTGATADLTGLLRDAVRRQVQADVPIGVFTSGGLDSALLATLATDLLGAHRIRTFAVGFPDRSYDERSYAERLAAHLGTTHASVTVRDEQVPEVLDSLAATGEPITDPAAVPTLILARAARATVTVVLSGEGADELFGGYPTYIGHRLVPTWSRLPRPVRSLLRHAVAAMPASQRAVSLGFLLKRFVAAADAPWPERHLSWFANGLPAELLQDGSRLDPADETANGNDPVTAAMRLDYAGPLRERLLVKVDRATMRASLEARAPFLDPAVTRAAFAAGGMHVTGVRTKRLLREVARPLVPRFILRRRKRGLSVPVARWLNGPLAATADRLLGSWGGPGGPGVARLLADHRAGRADHGRALWTLLVVQHWLEHWDLEIGS